MRDIEKLSSKEVASFIQQSPSIIMAGAVPEPIGDLPLGVATHIVDKICDRVSEKLDILKAPTLRCAYATPFKAFEGVVGVKREGQISQFADYMRSAAHWGVERFIFIDGSQLLSPLAEEAFKRYKKKLPSNFSLICQSWQHQPVVGDYIKNHFNGLNELWRRESAIYILWRELTEQPLPKSRKHKLFPENLFRSWKKRGMDPDKLRGYCQDANLSCWDSYEPSEKMLFEDLCQSLIYNISKKMEI